MQVDPIKPTLKAPGTKRLNLSHDQLLSSVAFKFNLCRYTEERRKRRRKRDDRKKKDEDRKKVGRALCVTPPGARPHVSSHDVVSRMYLYHDVTSVMYQPDDVTSVMYPPHEVVSRMYLYHDMERIMYSPDDVTSVMYPTREVLSAMYPPHDVGSRHVSTPQHGIALCIQPMTWDRVMYVTVRIGEGGEEGGGRHRGGRGRRGRGRAVQVDPIKPTLKAP